MAVDMFLKLEGIKGESQDHKHKDEIAITSWSWGMTQTGNTHIATGSGAGKVNVNDITVTKYLDKATVPLIQHCATGKHISKGLITCRKAGEKPLEYFKIDLVDILVSSVSDGGHSNDEIMGETITLNFAQFKVTYTPQKADGTGDAALDFGYNMQKNEKV